MYKIYLLKEESTGFGYVGQTTSPLYRRRCSHFHTKTTLVYASYIKNKLGRKDYKMYLLEETDTQEKADDLETFYIKKYNTVTPNGFNIRRIGGKHAPVESSTLEKIKSYKLNEEQLLKLSESHKGYTPTQEQKDKIGYAVQGSKHPNALLNEEKVKKIKILIKENNLSLREISKQFNVTISCISNIKYNNYWKHVNINEHNQAFLQCS